MCENWGNPEPNESIRMTIEEYEDLKAEKNDAEDQMLFYKENCEDLIKMIEFVEKGKRKIQCLYDLKDYIKKDLVTGNN